nr:class I SAM-dependent DNA methyltransferase [uncultured Deefgea sp.]
MNTSIQDLENRLWSAADQLWAMTDLKPSEFSTPVLGLLFLRYAETKFAAAEARFAEDGLSAAELDKTDFQADGVLYLTGIARFSYLVNLPEAENLGLAVNMAMAAVELENEELRGVLPRSYTRLDNGVIQELLRLLAPIKIEGDAFGRVYEYFLGNFAMKEGQKGGVFYTPTSIVKLIVEILQPYHGRIYDPACGSGGMFVQSAEFVNQHNKRAADELTVFGTEKSADTVKLGKMNLAVHGLSGDIRVANSFFEDPHESLGKFDFVMANPPFNVSGVDKDRIKGDPRLPFGLPSTDNANYLWIQYFYSTLNDTGRAGFVMANSAGDARGSELEIRKQMLQNGVVDAVVSIGSNFFYTVTLPCTLWFFDKAKRSLPPLPTAGEGRGEGRVRGKETVLFIDARHLYRQVSRSVRDFTPTQTEFLANIARLYRGEAVENLHDSAELIAQHFPAGVYADAAGLCKVATLADIEAQGWSLNPGRYVGVADAAADDFVFAERLEELSEGLVVLNDEARQLESLIAQNIALILDGVA